MQQQQCKRAFEQRPLMMTLRHLLLSFAGLALLSSPAKAGNIKTWHFDVNRSQLNFITDEEVQPKAELIANPTRLVIDLPGTLLKRPKIDQVVGKTIRAIRLGQLDPHTTRLVIELAPHYTLDPQQVRVHGKSSTNWFVQLPKPQLSTGNFPDRQKIVVSQDKIATKYIPENTFTGLVPLGQQMLWLRSRVAALKSQYPSLQAGMFFLDMDMGNYLDLHGSQVFPAASIIKLPILIAFFQDIDAGKVNLNEQLVMRPEMMASGSGTMQYLRPWRKFTALETITKMVTISDNTATNMIIKRLGGSKVLNQRFRSWGLRATVIRRRLPDLRGTNTTTAKDLVHLLALLSKEKLLSSQSKEQALDILRHTTIKTLLPAGLGQGAVIAHKTGDIGFAIGDAGIIDMPSGKRYLAAVLVKRRYRDPRGRNFIREVSQEVYSYLIQQPTASVPTASVTDAPKQ